MCTTARHDVRGLPPAGDGLPPATARGPVPTAAGEDGDRMPAARLAGVTRPARGRTTPARPQLASPATSTIPAMVALVRRLAAPSCQPAALAWASHRPM